MTFFLAILKLLQKCKLDIDFVTGFSNLRNIVFYQVITMYVKQIQDSCIVRVAHFSIQVHPCQSLHQSEHGTG